MPTGGWTWLCLESLIIKVFFFPTAFTAEDERDGASTFSPLQAFLNVQLMIWGHLCVPTRTFQCCSFPK